MPRVYFITHPDVIVDPELPPARWTLSERGCERMQRLLSQPWITGVTAVFCSAEQKAIEAAQILASHLKLDVEVVAELGECERHTTGFLSAAEFDAAIAEFFACPSHRVLGWESAADGQCRIVQAVDSIAARANEHGDIAIVSHGTVGALLVCQLLGDNISVRYRQPGSSGGNYFAFEFPAMRLLRSWIPIDAE